MLPDLLRDWLPLLLFMAATMLVALYGLAVSGHFPAEFRSTVLKSGAGALMLWGTLALAALAAALTLIKGWQALPWTAVVIGGGAMLLFAPLVLRPFPDSFVNGRSGLVVLSAGAALLALLLWHAVA